MCPINLFDQVPTEIVYKILSRLEINDLYEFGLCSRASLSLTKHSCLWAILSDHDIHRVPETRRIYAILNRYGAYVREITLSYHYKEIPVWFEIVTQTCPNLDSLKIYCQLSKSVIRTDN